MIQTIVYGFTIGAILYFFSVGLALTFGTMRIINFAHGMVYAVGVYLFIAFLKVFDDSFLLSLAASVIVMLPVAYIIERFIIRRLYGEGLDYAIIATYGVLLIGTDAIKMLWGTTSQPVNDPVGISIEVADFGLPVYRIAIFACAVVLFLALRLFFKRSIIGKIVIAALEDSDGVRCLGLDVNKYFSIIFVLGSALAVLGGILYAPISSAEPYMGFNILLLAFAVVIVGGMGNLNGTFFAALALGMVMAITGRFWSQAANAMVFVVMALVLIWRTRSGQDRI
ncbi:High-affinity branched-chain amino acid transport system permease protein LivH [Anaerolineae bacterium]|nr:High-affinity branched-chain amino acid transport system permease protein LivH [Anaerolineae bacterium]